MNINKIARGFFVVKPLLPTHSVLTVFQLYRFNDFDIFRVKLYLSGKFRAFLRYQEASQ